MVAVSETRQLDDISSTTIIGLGLQSFTQTTALRSVFVVEGGAAEEDLGGGHHVEAQCKSSKRYAAQTSLGVSHRSDDVSRGQRRISRS